MAYSNINKDKVQVELAKRLKKAIIAVILAVITISSWSNINQQIKVLNDAKKRNNEIELKITQLETKNKRMEKQVEIASSSAYLERQVRQVFGIGEPGDIWLQVDLGTAKSDRGDDVVVSEIEANIKQWWNLFFKE